MPGKWDGRSRIPTKQYKENYDLIFGKKEKKNDRSIRIRVRRSNKRK